jgi:hypothetical protein
MAGPITISSREFYLRDARDASVAERHIAAMGTVPGYRPDCCENML